MIYCIAFILNSTFFFFYFLCVKDIYHHTDNIVGETISKSVLISMNGGAIVSEIVDSVDFHKQAWLS